MQPFLKKSQYEREVIRISLSTYFQTKILKIFALFTIILDRKGGEV
jgi:hypothetical protein